MTVGKLLLIGCLFILAASCEFKNEEDEFGTACDTLNLKYADIELIVSANCYYCHGETPSAPFSLNSYNKLVNAIETRPLYEAVNHLPGASWMPKGGAKLDSCSVLKINAWINDGTPE